MLISFDDFRKNRLQEQISDSSVQEAIDLHFDRLKVEMVEAARLKVVLNESYDPLAQHVMESVVEEDNRQSKILIEAYIEYVKTNFHNYVMEAWTMDSATDVDSLRKNLTAIVQRFAKSVKSQIGKILNTNRTTAEPSEAPSLSPPPHPHSGDDGGSVASSTPVPASAGKLAGAGAHPVPDPTATPAPKPMPFAHGPSGGPAPTPEEPAKGGWPWRRFDTSKGNWLSRGAKGLANLVRTPIHWAVNKLKNAWHGKSLPENVINSMALLLEAAADEQALAIDKLIDDMSAKLLTYINQNIDSYAAALKKMPTPAPKATPDVVPTDPTGKPLGKPEAGPGAVAPGGPALNVDKGDAAKALPPEKVAAATGVDPKTADAAAASGVDPLAKRVEFLKAVAGGQKLNTAFLKALQGALTNVDAGEAIRKRPLIKKLIAGITSDDPHGEWTKIGGLPKIHRSRAIPALDILKQAVVNAITKKDAGQPADLADEIIDLMRHEDKRKPVGPEGMAAIFDRIKKKGKAVGDAGVAPGKPPVAPTPGTTGKPTNPAVTGMDMDPRNPGEPPAGKTPLAPTPEAPGAGQTYKIMGKDMDEGTAIRTVLDMISNAKATSPLSVLAKTGMEFDKDPFFTKYLPDLIKENWLGVSHMPGAENGLDENILTTLLKRAVKKYPNKESLNPEVLKWAGVPVMDTAATPPKSDVAPEVKTGDAPQGDVAASKGDVAPEVKAGEPKPDAVTPPEVKGEEPNPEDEKAEQHAQSIIDSYLAANKKKYHVSPGAMPIVKRRAAVALLIQDGVDIEPDAYKTMSNRKIAELIATKFKPEGEKPAEKPPEKPAEKPAEEAPKDDDQKKKE